MESNESSNMAAATNSPIDIVQSLMQDQGYLQEAFESSYESMDFLNQPDAATSAVAKDTSSKTYAPEEFLNEPGVSQVTNKNNDSTQSEFERLLNEDIVDDTDDIVVGLSSEAVTFLDKATEEFGIVSKPISDKDVDKPDEKINDDSSSELKLGLRDVPDDKTVEKINQDTSKGLGLGLDDADDKIEEVINQDSSKGMSLGLDDASDSDKIDEKIHQDASTDLSLGLHVTSDAKVDLVVKVAESSTLVSVPKLTEEDSAQITKEKSDIDAKSNKEDEETSDSIIQIENIATVSHAFAEKTQTESHENESGKTKDICSSSNTAEIVTTESLEAMLESLDGPAAPDLIESEGSSNSITVNNTFIRESLQELMEETPSTSEQDDWLMAPVNKRSAPVDCVTADDAVSNTTLDDTHSCLDIDIKEEVESENEISFTDTFCERSCLIDQDTDRHNFKMFECKVLSIDLHDIVKTESARDAKAGLYKPSERKSIDIIRKEYKTKAMQDYIRRAKRMKLPVEKATRRSTSSLFSSPARKIINKTSKTLPKTPSTTTKSAAGHRTPAQSSKKALAQSSNKTPAQSSNKTPAQSSNKTPAQNSNNTPVRSSYKTPARSSVKTPSGRSSVKTPSRSSVKTSSSQNSIKTPSARRAIKTPSRFSDESPSQNSNKTPSSSSNKTPTRSSIKTPTRSSIKTPSVQSTVKTLSTRSSLRTQSQTIGKTSVESKTLVNVSQNTRKRTPNEIQTPKRMRTNQEEEISPQASKKIRFSPDASKKLNKKKIPVSSKKKKTKDNVSFETATKLLTIDLQDIMKISKYSNSKLMKGTKVDFSKSKGRNIKRTGIYRKPIRSKESKRTSIKTPLKATAKKNTPATIKSPSKSKVEVKSKSVPKNNVPKVPILESRSTRTFSTRRKPLIKSSKEVQSVKRLRPKRDSEGKLKKRKQNDYVDDMFDDDNDDYDEDYQPSRVEANYTCFDCMEDFETNAELKVHKRLEHNKSTTNTPRKTPVKTAPKKKKGTVPVYFKSDQYRIDRTVGKKSMKEFQPSIDALNKDDMIQGANMVNHHITFYNHELGKNVTDQEIYQHMMKKYTIKSAQLCIGSNRFRSYYQLANSPDNSLQTNISTVTEERGHVLITSPLLHW